MPNSLFCAGFGAPPSAAVSAISGYTLPKYRFRGREAIVGVLLTGVRMPPVILAIPVARQPLDTAGVSSAPVIMATLRHWQRRPRCRS
ncbi:hypothetical protein GTY85_22635 [Streptomyces sp. SID8377]|nr:hypothetical protein [Streptomyces sp. SID8377]